jgi:hypothetical protein
MTTSAARDQGLRRLSDLTTWLGVGAVAVTGAFVGLAAHATHSSTASSQSTSATSSAAGLTAAQVSASAGPSHVRAGAS